MKRRKKILWRVVTILLTLMPMTRAMSACLASDDNEEHKLSFGTKLLMMDKGETIGLTYTFSSNYENIPKVTWSTDNGNIAIVSEEGNVTAVSEGSCIIAATCGEYVQDECLVVVGNTSGTSDGHDYVDLGLPSGTFWATTNIGASSPDEAGLFFQWGKTIAHEAITNDSVETSDGIGELPTDADAADASWGAYWRIPSRAQVEELVNSSYTTITQTSMNGEDGILITSLVNGKCIFMPATSNQNGENSGNPQPIGNYWSRTPSDNGTQAYGLHFTSANPASCIPTELKNALTIRPVYEGIKTNPSIIVNSSDLNFGTVAVGNSRSMSFEVWNNSFERQEILPFGLDNTDFAIDWKGGELQPNATQTVTVTYNPSTTVIATGGTLSIGTLEWASLVNVFASSHKGSSDLTTKKNLVVWGKDASQTTFVLNEQPIVTVADGKVKVESATTSAEFNFAEILKLTYEGLIDPSTSLNDIDTKKSFVKTADALLFSSDCEDLHVQIASLAGMVIRQFTVKQGTTFSLPLYQLPTGVYVISVNKISYKIAIR